MAAAVLTPIRFSPWARPTVVVVLPSPSGVGVIAVTTILAGMLVVEHHERAADPTSGAATQRVK